MIKIGDNLKCIKLEAAWWGTIFEPGNFYNVVNLVSYDRTYIDPNHEKEYWEHNQMAMNVGQKLIDLHKKIKTTTELKDIENLNLVKNKMFDELSSKQKKIMDIMSKWEKKIELPFCIIKSEMDNSPNCFLISKKSELMDKIGTIQFQSTTYFLEDYFDMTAIHRDEKLNQLGI